MGFRITNKGLDPAMILPISIYHNNEKLGANSVSDWNALRQIIPPDVTVKKYHGSYLLQPGETNRIIWMEDSTAANDSTRLSMETNMRVTHLVICYRSLYGECFVTTANRWSELGLDVITPDEYYELAARHCGCDRDQVVEPPLGRLPRSLGAP
jgi:hypothetical protein